jgi:hypothetical protein
MLRLPSLASRSTRLVFASALRTTPTTYTSLARPLAFRTMKTLTEAIKEDHDEVCPLSLRAKMIISRRLDVRVLHGL